MRKIMCNLSLIPQPVFSRFPARKALCRKRLMRPIQLGRNGTIRGRLTRMPSRPPVHRPPGQGDRKTEQRRYDRDRDKQDWRTWYKTAAWQRRRADQLAAEPLCAICKKAGRITAASVADHPIPHRGDYDLFWRQKLQSLCDQAPWRCHSSEKQRQERLVG